MKHEPLLLSTVTPVYKGAPYLQDLVYALNALRGRLENGEVPLRLAEAVFVVDDAVDESEAVLAELAQQYDWVHVVTLSSNYGQHAATVAGILHTSGDWIATLDEDLQHPPALIPDLLLALVKSRGDLMYAHPEKGPHAKAFRNHTSRWAKRVIGWLAGTPRLLQFNSFRVGRGPLLRAAASLAGRGVYLDVALSWVTRRVHTLKVDLHDPRPAEQSGYSIMALLRHAKRMVMSSEVKTFRLGFLIGGLATLAGLVGLAMTFYLKFFSPESIPIQGWASIFVAVVFFGGLTAVMAGVILEYVASLHQTSLGRPIFLEVDRSSDQRLLREPASDREAIHADR